MYDRTSTSDFRIFSTTPIPNNHRAEMNRQHDQVANDFSVYVTLKSGHAPRPSLEIHHRIPNSERSIILLMPDAW